MPLFLLAAPTIFTNLHACRYFFNQRKYHENKYLDIFYFLFYEVMDPHSMLPFILHSIFLCIIAVLFINVEVITRLLYSSNPIVYLYAAHLLSAAELLKIHHSFDKDDLLLSLKHLFNAESKPLRLYLYYCTAYITVGTIMHANNLPWTWACKWMNNNYSDSWRQEKIQTWFFWSGDQIQTFMQI